MTRARSALLQRGRLAFCTKHEPVEGWEAPNFLFWLGFWRPVPVPGSSGPTTEYWRRFLVACPPPAKFGEEPRGGRNHEAPNWMKTVVFATMYPFLGYLLIGTFLQERQLRESGNAKGEVVDQK